MSAPESSRSLLLPGPQPPLSHFGATLLRHVVMTGMRYAFDSLGAPIPERPPVRIVGLRFYLDRTGLREALGAIPAAGELLGACLEPGGQGSLPAGSGSLRGAIAFHRGRLRLRLGRRPQRLPAPEDDVSPERLWWIFRSTLSAHQPALNDALLGELLASLERRAARARGRRLERCLGRQAFALHTGRRAELESLGVADPLVDSWRESTGVEEHVVSRLNGAPEIGDARLVHPLRGEFREAYRRALNPIRAAYLRFASDARRRGAIEEVGDAFFIPFDLTEELASDSSPDWLRPAVRTNRAEYQSLLETDSPPESIGGGSSEAPAPNRRDWMLAPIWPLE